MHLSFYGVLYTFAGTYFLLFRKKHAFQAWKNRNEEYGPVVDADYGHPEYPVFLFRDHDYLNLAFILLFFGFGVFLPVYFRYRADLSKLLIHGESNLTFDRFCEKFEISKREKEVIHEICKGLTNQQIADKLFISLQTVKDHTHRIYGKTFCTSRAQLMRMVNEEDWL